MSSLLVAVASTAAGVRVDLSKSKPATTPANLLDLRFNDPRVGLKTAAHLDALRATLGRLIPHAQDDLASLALTPNLRIGDAAARIDDLLANAAQAPAVIVMGALSEARKKVADRWGKALAAKSTDALLRRLTSPVRETFAAPSPVSGIVLEFTDQGAEALLAPRATSRTQRLASMRDAFYRVVTPLRVAIERNSGTPSVQLCWLNATMHVQGQTTAVAGVADHSELRTVDVARRLRREMNVASVTVGAVSARKRLKLTGAGIRVAVIDGEVHAGHPALAGRVSLQENFTSEPFGSPDAHGTAVAGIIAADSKRYGGIAPGATILSYKVFPTNATEGDEFQGLLAIEHALRDGVDIANCSWGIGPAGDGTDRAARAFDRAWQEGLILIKSAGNDGPDADTLTSPCDAAGVLVVGATERQGKAVQPYSSRGPTSNGKRPDLAAPGGLDTSNMMTCLATGGFGGAGFGTSYAAPVVSGAAALLREKYPTSTPDEIRARLLTMCKPFADGDANAGGAGLLDLALFSA